MRATLPRPLLGAAAPWRSPLHAERRDGLGALPWSLLVWPLAALAVGLLSSVQFLFQPFVWRHWPIDEVAWAWLEVARDRVVVALPVGLLLGWAVVGEATPLRRSLRVGVAVVLGASVGEMVLLGLDTQGHAAGIAAMGLRIARWCVVGFALAALLWLWRRLGAVRAAAQGAELAHVQAQRDGALQQLQALRSQIEPHFLFNTLATVRRLQAIDATQGQALLAHLIDFLRLAGATPQAGMVALGSELALVRAYLAVVAQRLGRRLTFEIDVADTWLGADVPPYCVATLVENAVKHGIEPSPQGGTIRVVARQDGAMLVLGVEDTGIGLHGTGGSGIGLANIRARLRSHFGDAAALRLTNLAPHGVRAEIRLPCPGAKA
jgi:signal transduction histidine kinase